MQFEDGSKGMWMVQFGFNFWNAVHNYSLQKNEDGLHGNISTSLKVIEIKTTDTNNTHF